MPSTFNGPFLAIPRWAMPRVCKNPSALQVLCALVDHMDIRTKCAKVSLNQLSTDTETSRKTVQRSLRWLESGGVISTEKGVHGVSSYTIRYEEGRSRVTWGEVTGDLGGRSRVTWGEVISDTPGGIKNDDLPGLVGTYREVIENVKEQPKRVSDPEGGTEMLIGGDQDDENRKAHRQQRDAKNRTACKTLVNKFLHHPKQFTREKPTEADVLILRRAIQRLLDNGMSPVAVSTLIDFFMGSHFVSYDQPIRAFASKKIQDILIKKSQVTITHEDPVVQYLSQECLRGELSLPWPEERDAALQDVLMRRSLEATFRYPELIAQLITHWAGDFDNPAFTSALTDLEEIVRHGLGLSSVNVPEIAERLTMLDLPKDLLKGKVRTSPDTMVSAVYESRRSPNV